MDYSNYAEEMEEFRENLTLGLVSALGESKHLKNVENDEMVYYVLTFVVLLLATSGSIP